VFNNGNKKFWHENLDNLDLVIELAKELLNKHPKASIFCLGQSFAWPIRTAQLLASTKCEKKYIQFIPFSGRFYNASSNAASDVTRRYFLSSSLRPKYEKKYRTVLTKLNLHPQTIIDKYQKLNEKSVVFEYINRGESLASFISVLFLWAKELCVESDLKKALEVNLIYPKYYRLTNIVLPNDGISITCIRYHEDLNCIMRFLANGDAELTPKSFRLVPPYKCNHWNEPPEKFKPNNHENVSKIEKKLTLAIKNYSKKDSVPKTKTAPTNPNVFYKPTQVKKFGNDGFVLQKNGNRYRYQENKFFKYIVQNNRFGYPANISESEIKNFKNEVFQKFQITF